MPGMNLSRAIEAMAETDAIWGRTSVAFVLTEAFYSDNPYVTADSLAARLGMSDDTARRWLNDLARKKVVLLDIINGRRLYRADPVRAARVAYLLDTVNEP